MGETVKLTADDGHSFDAYVARPAEQPKAGVVVVQEIFGVNKHVRGVADGFAKEGYLAVAPAMFDRVTPRIELGRSDERRVGHESVRTGRSRWWAKNEKKEKN